MAASVKLATLTCKAKRSCVERGYVVDAYIKHFAELDRMMDPTMNRGYYARMAAIDLVVSDFRGTQIVVLGAGLDTGYFRRREFKYFEVDVEAVCAKKRPVLKKLKADYSLVSCDLGDVDALREALRAEGLDETEPTLFIAECVFSYLEETKFAALLTYAAATFPESAVVSYDVLAKDDAFGKLMRRNFEHRGWPVLAPSPTIEAHEKRFHEFADAAVVDMHALYQNVILATPAERARVNKLEIFDDPDEFKLFMEHYCFVVAANGALVDPLVGNLRRRLREGPVLDPPLSVEALIPPPPLPTSTPKKRRGGVQNAQEDDKDDDAPPTPNPPPK
mmetsp:Transcript_17111/g.55578  ORF Transcript_17111/g.55578 Transcript_17111/m.55578 type:complete len:334 (-) Transcript_17111:1603-2604(-)